MNEISISYDATTFCIEDMPKGAQDSYIEITENEAMRVKKAIEAFLDYRQQVKEYF